jgi:outer membrane protein assembly factor BamB
MTVIDLGLVTSGDQPPPASERRARDRRDVRRVLIAVVAAFCVLTVTGSARPDPRGLPRLWSIPYSEGGDAFTLNGDALYLLTTAGDTKLTAYDLRTGAIRWSNGELADTTSPGSIEGGVILLPAGSTTARYTAEDGTEAFREFSRETVAVDTATGRELWRRAGEFNVATGDLAVLTELNDEGSAVMALRAVRLSDGSPVWSHPAGNLESWFSDRPGSAAAERLITITPEGWIEVLNLADGALVTSGQLPWGRQPPKVDEYSSVTPEGRRLYLIHTRPDRSTITAYETDTLRELWQMERQSRGGIEDCGSVVCFSSENELAGYDRDSGQPRWRVPGAANAFPLSGGRVLVAVNETGARLLDAGTGRQLADLGAAGPVWSFGAAASPYLVAPTREPAGFMSVSRVDPRSGEVLMRGTIVPVGGGCQSADSLLACVTQNKQLIVTDVG